MCLKGHRIEDYSDPNTANEMAETLYNCGLLPGSEAFNEELVLNILVQSSSQQIKLISDSYAGKYNNSLNDVIKSVLGSDIEQALQIRCDDKHKYYAKVLHDAWNGNGICMQYRISWHKYAICMEYGWNMYGICMEYVWNMHGIR